MLDLGIRHGSERKWRSPAATRDRGTTSSSSKYCRERLAAAGSVDGSSSSSLTCSEFKDPQIPPFSS
ncbi:hypothetical protein SLEP1_g40410 [Rubroshorea leprosula]|uniref:Uncharacterized protein n=1 Tax=Rubroshorea leprosula TaxID=152421 RepID=A0AAV5L3B3_9ROSI|nr:hypothetical protein SLEP1_g40410 [Rubroshorea leprosula]